MNDVRHKKSGVRKDHSKWLSNTSMNLIMNSKNADTVNNFFPTRAYNLKYTSDLYCISIFMSKTKKKNPS